MIEVLKQALEALEVSTDWDLNATGKQGKSVKAIMSLRQAIAELKSQEPVSALWQHGETGRFRVTTPDSITDCDARWFKVGDLYTHPPQRKPLTDEMAKQMKERCDSMEMRGAFADGWLSAEAAHGIKE